MTVWPGRMGKNGKWSGVDTFCRKYHQRFMMLGCEREGEFKMTHVLCPEKLERLAPNLHGEVRPGVLFFQKRPKTLSDHFR